MQNVRLFRPAGFLKFYLRFEDFTKADDDAALSDDEASIQWIVAAQTNRKKADAALARARAHREPTAAANRAARQSKRAVDQRNAKKPASAPQSLQGGDPYSTEILLAPTDMTIELNGPYQCDKLTATFQFSDAPLMSQLIRSSLVEGYLGTVPSQDFGKPDRWQLPMQRAQIMFRGYVDDWDTNHTDEDASITICARSVECVLVDGKINPWAKDYRVKGNGEPITDYVDRILSLFPPTSGTIDGRNQLRSLYYPGNLDGLTAPQRAVALLPPVLDRKRLMRTLQSAQSRNQAAGGVPGVPNPPAPQEDTPGVPPGSGPGTGNPAIPGVAPLQEMPVWELITRACRLAGVIPVYDPSLAGGNHILLRPPQTLFATVDGNRINGGPPDGFSRSFYDEKSKAFTHSDIRLMVWGQNLKSFKTNRKLGRIKAPAIEVISYNRDAEPAKRTLVIRFPPGTKRPAGAKKSGKDASGAGAATVGDKRGSSLGHKGQWAVDHVQTVNIGAVRDIYQLAQIAVGLYHDVARQELSVKIETDDMSSWFDPRLPFDPNEEPDLLKLRSGSPVRVTVARANNDPKNGQVVLTELSDIFEKREGALKNWLLDNKRRLYPAASEAVLQEKIDAVFKKFARAYQTDRMTEVFYCRVVNHHFNWQDGWSADMELVNFLESRSLPRNMSEEAQAIDNAARIPPASLPPEQKRTVDQQVQNALERLKKIL